MFKKCSLSNFRFLYMLNSYSWIVTLHSRYTIQYTVKL